jgi:hypothetical protein
LKNLRPEKDQTWAVKINFNYPKDELDELDDELKEIASSDLSCPNLATKNSYGGGRGEEIHGRREYVDEEVKAVKLFFFGGDEFQRRH